MFIKSDIYTTSGSVKLYHCWTDKVTKFDPSSFYNWEQDNLPVHDLEERTFYLWEQLGYPTSSIPGVVLAVSADASDADFACNKNIFRSVSSAVQALPQVINYPIIIEVANFGQLGDLTLNNFKFGPKGSLEIINRNFSKQDYAVSNSTGMSTPQLSANYIAGYPQNYVSSFSYVGGTSPTNPEITPHYGFIQASCLSISSPVFSSTYDARFSGITGNPKLNAYISVWKVSTNYNKSTLVIDDNNNINPFAIANTHSLSFRPYATNSNPSDDIYNKDASTIDYLTNETLYGTNSTILNSNRAYNGLYYGNKLSKIVINNCDGPIFIRNFFLDGQGNSLVSNNYGIEVNGSNNVYLENVVSTRYRKAGLYFNNSTVNILRSCVANRIYDYDADGNRLTGNYSNRRLAIGYNDISGYLYQDYAAGIVANNSTINLSSTRTWQLDAYQTVLGSTYKPLPLAYTILEFNENSNGIILNNSQLIGGDSVRPHSQSEPQLINRYVDPSSSNYVGQTILDLNSNTNCGILATNSKISLNGKLRLIENLKGAEINSSQLEIEQLECLRNQKIGVELNNSVGIYNKNLKKFHSSGTYIDTIGGYPFWFEKNGVHLYLNNSNFKPVVTSSMEQRYANMIFASSLISNLSSIQESISVNNNSELVLVSPKISRSNSQVIEDRGKKGSEISCNQNSKTTLRGTKYYPIRVNGPTTADLQRRLAAICANKNSTVDINGPAIIAQFGVDLLADSNSTISITSPKNELDGSLDFSSISLSDPANHTMVELHSSRSCIVADNNSIINMKDLGSYRTRWDMTGVFNSYAPDYGGIVNDVFNSTYVSGGSLQFYPNPNSNTPNSAANISTLLATDKTFIKYPQGYGALISLQTPVNDFSSVTFGGMCVRALNGSLVNVNNVNFPCGWWNPSAVFYSDDVAFSGGGICNRTFIWNVADTSQLKSSFLSVSGLFPRLAGYVGPYGYWASGSGNRAASGLPSSTPDTGSVSILDIYGANASGHAYTSDSASNYGPFRLYFSVNPFVNTLTELNGSSNYGIINQIYSQGYQPSNSLVCSGSVSSLYKMALQRNSSNNIVPSGFYYGSGVMDITTFNRVKLDESSAETFANAKHCATGKSGNARLVSIYYPYTGVNYGDSISNLGIGSVNVFDIERDN